MTHCSHELRKVELDYIDGDVKIDIQKDLFIAPQHLIGTIKKSIQSMVHKNATLTVKSLSNTPLLTDKNHSQLRSLAQSYKCDIAAIHIATKNEPIALPMRDTVPLSKYLLKQSEEFHSSLSVRKVISVSGNTIEVQKSDDFEVRFISLSDSMKYSLYSRLI